MYVIRNKQADSQRLTNAGQELDGQSLTVDAGQRCCQAAHTNRGTCRPHDPCPVSVYQPGKASPGGTFSRLSGRQPRDTPVRGATVPALGMDPSGSESALSALASAGSDSTLSRPTEGTGQRDRSTLVPRLV